MQKMALLILSTLMGLALSQDLRLSVSIHSWVILFLDEANLIDSVQV